MTDVKYMNLNGKIVPPEEATLHILSPAVKYACNVFEGIRGYWNDDQQDLYIFRLTEHLERIRYSMKVMRMDPIFDIDTLRDGILELIQANGFKENTFIRLYAYVDEPDGDMTATGPVGMAIAAQPKASQVPLNKGWDVAVSSWARIADHSLPARIKCVANYNNGRLALGQVRADGYDNVIILTQAGRVAEGAGACVFLVRNGVPVTPDATSDILESVTRSTVLQLFQENMNLVPEVRSVGRTELYGAEEAFYCGTSYEITPIASIDRMPVGDGSHGPVVTELHRIFHAVVRGESNEHPEWLTPVYGGTS